MSYAVQDFHETLFNSEIAGQIAPDAVKRVVAAWGRDGDCSEWDGGFLLELHDGRAAYIEGWCDTTGWGCQDGASVRYFDAVPDYHTIERKPNGYGREALPAWDQEPADLNRYIAGGYKSADRYT